MTVAITPTQRNSCRYMILDQNLGKNLKRYAKTLLSHLERTHKKCPNQPKLLPNSQPGVHQLDCACIGRYVGESKRKALTRCH